MAVAALFLPGLVALFFSPGTVDGIYNPLRVYSTMGCDCDQFVEFRDGVILYHVIDASPSLKLGEYKADASGHANLMGVKKPGKERGVYATAQPFFLGTWFYYPNQGKGEFAWKRFKFPSVMKYLRSAEIVDVEYENEGIRLLRYDANMKVIKNDLRRYPATPVSPSGQPAN